MNPFKDETSHLPTGLRSCIAKSLVAERGEDNPCGTQEGTFNNHRGDDILSSFIALLRTYNKLYIFKLPAVDFDKRVQP